VRTLAVGMTALIMGLVMGSASLPAFADNASTDATRICESARLTDLERRECRAMYKAATNGDAREAVLRSFAERISGLDVSAH
jgi:hypothetical protein